MAIEDPFVLLFFLLLLISFFSTLIYCTSRVHCSCEICHAYVTSTWSIQFDNLCDWYTHLLQKSPTKTIHIHVLDNIITSNHESVEYMLKTRFENYPKGKPFSVILGDFLGRGIFNVDGDSWRFQRKMACLELGKLSMRSHAFEVVNNEIDHRLIPLVSSFSEKQREDLDLQDVFRRFSFDVICKFSFGFDPKCLDESLPVSDLAVSFDLASKLSAQRAMNPSPLVWKMKRMLNIGSEKRLKDSIKMVNMFAGEVIQQRNKLGSCSNHEDLLSRFMATTKDSKYLRDIVISFMLAGRDTVASALTGLFWLLAHHPRVVATIREEVDKVEALTSFDQIREHHYLQAVVFEGMRLFPPIQFNSKFCLQNDTFPDGTFVKKGTRVTYHSYAMGRMETIWGPDCSDFKPERWLKDGVFFQETPFKYPVFQAGYRMCLGKEMALVEMKSVVISLLRRFNIQLATPVQTPRFSPGLTATFTGGLQVRVSERRGKT
ncbi:cytochrome P450 [Cynara cardunculus var. scolymus]|uniref:Cytochrome P450 n=1 Tax=Cynara cardunculus var. scolymus TaxID=59895 RepID=A0A118JZG7_CYNCS|nr:cytochrome P450 [Cynara cardunculus var. scolymus]